MGAWVENSMCDSEVELRQTSWLLFMSIQYPPMIYFLNGPYTNTVPCIMDSFVFWEKSKVWIMVNKLRPHVATSLE